MTSLIRTLQGCSAIGQTPGHLIGPDEMGDLNAQGATSRFRGTQLLVVRLNKFFIGLGSIGGKLRLAQSYHMTTISLSSFCHANYYAYIDMIRYSKRPVHVTGNFFKILLSPIRNTEFS